MAATTYELIVKTVDQTSGPMSRITGGLGKGKIAFAAVAASAAAMGKAMLDASKQMETITNQLRLVTKNSSDLAATQTRLTQLARANRSTLGPTVELYTKLKVATEELGFSNERVEGLVTKLQQALVVAGADAGTAAGVIKQFGQAMASGSVRGDEFNSIVEGLGPALAIMARESGITVGQLREMAGNGELTAEVFAKLLEKSNALTESFDKMQTPLDTLEEQLSEAFTTYLANLSKSIGLTSSYRTLLETLINKFDGANNAANEQTLTVDNLTKAIGTLRAEQDALNVTQGGHAGRNARRRNQEIEESIAKMTAMIETLKEQARAEEHLAAIQKRNADAAALRTKLDEAAKNVALQAIEGYIKLADSVKNVNSEYELASPLEQAKMRLEELVTAQRNLATTQNDGIVEVENFHIRMRGLSEAIIVQEAEIKKLIAAEEEKARKEKELADAAMQRSTAASRVIESIRKEQEDLRSLQLTLNQVGEIARKLGIDEAKLTEELQRQINVINGVTTARDNQKKGMQTYSEFLDEINKKARENIRLEGFQKKAHDETIRAMLAGNISGEEARARLDVLGFGRRDGAPSAGQGDVKQVSAKDQLINRLKDQKAAMDSLTMSNAELAEAAEKAGVSQEVFKRQLEQAREGINIFKTDAQLMQEELEASIERVSQSISQQLATAIVEGRNMSDVFKNIFKQMLANILQQILQSQIQSALMSLFPGGGGMGGGSPIMSFIGMGLGLLANGGVAQSTKPYVVGERGPELFMPGTTGRVIPNDELQGGAAPVVNFNINAVDTQTGTEFILKNKKQIEGVIQSAYDRRGRRGIA